MLFANFDFLWLWSEFSIRFILLILFIFDPLSVVVECFSLSSFLFALKKVSLGSISFDNHLCSWKLNLNSPWGSTNRKGLIYHQPNQFLPFLALNKSILQGWSCCNEQNYFLIGFSTSTKSNKLIIRKKKDCIISMRKKALKICPTRDIFHNGFIDPCNYVLLLAF